MDGYYYLVLCGYIGLYIQGSVGLYFPQLVYNGLVQPSDEIGDGLVKLYLVSNTTDPKLNLTIYHITGYDGGQDGVDYTEAFGVNTSGWLYLKDPNVFSKSQDTRVTLHIEAQSEDPDGQPPTSADVILTFNDPDEDPCSDACFQEMLQTFYVEENAGSLFLGRLGINTRHLACDKVDISYAVTAFHVPRLNLTLNPREWLYVDSRTSEIVLMKSLDREAWDEASINLICQAKHRNGTTEVKQRNLTLTVSDVDDCAPVLRNSRSRTQKITEEWDYDAIQNQWVVVTDNDTAGTADYEIFLRGNESGWFRISKTRHHKVPDKVTGIYGTIWNSEIRLVNDEKPPGITRTSLEVVFRDKLYESKDSTLSPEVVVEVNVKFAEPEVVNRIVHNRFTVRVSRQAARMSQVLNLGKEIPFTATKSPYGFYMDTDKPHVFKMTQKTGILYVDKPYALASSTQAVINLTVNSFNISPLKTILITVHLMADSSHSPLPCEDSCSYFKQEDECNKACGLGAATGRCVMRKEKSSSSLTSHYGTCSPNLITCPDSVCDELEKENTLLCPQDCAEIILGSFRRNGKGKGSRGIHSAKGTCWCDARGECQCWPTKTLKLNPSAEESAPPVELGWEVTGHGGEAHVTDHRLTSTNSNSATEASGVTGENDEILSPACGTVCKTIAGLVTVAIGVLLATSFLALCVHRRRKRRTDELRHVGSNVSMNAIPSDYVEERRTSHNSIDWSPKIINTQYNYDNKWEFPRKNLILGKNLGEGEFGQVVKAKAYRITPGEECTPVAVKMLKNCSNETEYQDLVSEFNLLKDVSHPNVIKLLGACTKEEPLYIIVEYCEHGSLRHYLRACRHNNALYMEGNVDPGDGPPTSPVQFKLSTRDLLSFAWQISKGMHYLADMKVVHRDLAARNVLVAAGKVVKISDFGLSRDVYEADAYMKKSKGRIPVKWMAPESLYDQVYTTKSDVWSYGIVLWEIVTLGATPYPGIPPERLFGLLKTGYRMDRPDNCSDELYAVMQKCWKAEPARRPLFGDLTNIFDSMLQAKMEYLDLNGACRAPFELDYDISLDGLTSGSPVWPRGGIWKEQYPSNVTLVQTDSSSYLTPTSKTEQVFNRENSSRGKTFPKNDTSLQVGYKSDKRRLKLDFEVDAEENALEPKETDLLRCTKV